jgi:hypothetical protein
MRIGIPVAALGLAALIGAQQIPTIRVPVRLVSLPTLVFSAENRLIPGLRAVDFRVLDNGRPQAIALDTSTTPISVALAIQANMDVREYVPFIAKAGSVVDALLAGESAKQRQLEDAIAAVGVELRSAYLLSYYANPEEAGYHTVGIEVDIPGAKVYSRPGYWLGAD